MANGGGIAKKTVAPADDSVDAATVARWLNCSTRMVRQYAEEGLAVRTGPGRFDLERVSCAAWSNICASSPLVIEARGRT